MKRAHVNSGPAAAAGFTLVELLLAITLLSILLALTYSGLRAASRSTESGEELMAFTGGMRASHQFVRRQVFLGDSREIWFVAPMPGYLGSGGPQVQVLELAQGDDGDVLQFRHALLQYFEEEYLYDRDPVILLEGLESADFEFVGLDEEGVLTPWMSTWDQPGILPVAVRLNIEFDEDRNAHWPVMVAGVRVDEEALQIGAVRPTYEQSIMDLSRQKGGTQ
jgi:general secretion pathway protein J